MYGSGLELERNQTINMLISASEMRPVALAGMILATLGCLSGCGFSPMLGSTSDQSSVADEFAKIKVGYIENRSGQILRNNLVKTLNPRGEPSRPEYTLVIRIEEPQQNLAFQRNNSVTNVNSGVQAYWSLRDNNGATVYSATSTSIQQYVISSSPYAAVVSAQNARDQNLGQITQDIRNKLAHYFFTRAPAPTKSDH